MVIFTIVPLGVFPLNISSSLPYEKMHLTSKLLHSLREFPLFPESSLKAMKKKKDRRYQCALVPSLQVKNIIFNLLVISKLKLFFKTDNR